MVAQSRPLPAGPPLAPAFPPASTATSPEGYSSSTPVTQVSSSLPPQPYSCLQCKHRKVKCDRVDPCANCRKASVVCVYSAPHPRKRRKHAHPDGPIDGPGSPSGGGEGHDEERHVTEREKVLLEKVSRYESLLIDLGAMRRSTVGNKDEGARTPVARDRPTPDGSIPEGKLVGRYGNSRYLENNLWTQVTEELQDPRDILEESSGADTEDDQVSEATRQKLDLVTPDPVDLILSARPTDGAVGLRALHPQPVQIFLLWQAFVDNVNPLVKILHVPTTQKVVLETVADLDHVSKAMEALLFGIYLIATLSMEEAECESVLHESKASAVQKFRTGAQQALRAAGVLRMSNIVVLQAFTLFLSAALCYHDPPSLWSLTGASIRIGQRIGLHRDGELLNLPPFETEMRRRLWMIMVQLDLRVAELCGCGVSVATNLWSSKLPLNVNDCDIYPGMREPPVQQDSATEMIFVLLRANVAMFLKQGLPGDTAFDGCWSGLSDPAIEIVVRDRAINEFAKMLEEKFIRHCDLQIPVQRMTFLGARATICKMRLFAHFPRGTRGSASDSGPTLTAQLSADEETLLFTNSLQILQCCAQMHISQSLRRFFWHIEVHFPWHALVYLLIHLRTHAAPSAEADAAWATIDELFTNHPDMIRTGRSHSKLCNAVDSLILKAWEAHETELRRSTRTAQSAKPPLPCIQKLRELRKPRHREEEIGLPQDLTDGFDSSLRPSNDSGGVPVVSDGVDVDASPIDWEEWDLMCQEFQMEGQEQDHLGDNFWSI